jgi:hypothetical protein
MHLNLTSTIFRALAVPLLTALTLSGCFEPAVIEKLTLDFKSSSAVEVAIDVVVAPPSEIQSASARERADRYRKELDNQYDAWSRRFADLDAQSERFLREVEARALKHVARSAVVRPEALQRFFADTGVTVSMIEGHGWRELSLYPGTSTRATTRQRAEMKRQVDRWSAHLSDYFASLEKLYRYLEHHPDRAESAFAGVLEEVVPNPPDDPSGLTIEEQELVGGVRAAMEPVTAALVAEDEQAYSLDELTSLVYDPFPCEVIVRVSGRILESEGFEEVEEDELRVPPLRLWTQLEQLQEPWIRPDPLLVLVRAIRSREDQLDLSAFSQQERQVLAVPSAAQIRTAMEDRLVRTPLYRVRWRG